MRLIVVLWGDSMKIVIYAFDKCKDIMRLTLNYCQQWDCYPSIEHLYEKEHMLSAIEKKDIDVVILSRSKEDNAAIVKEISEKGIDIEFIWLEDALLDKKCLNSEVKRQKQEAMMKDKIEKGLLACVVLSSMASLCRVHLKPKQNISLDLLA